MNQRNIDGVGMPDVIFPRDRVLERLAPMRSRALAAALTAVLLAVVPLGLAQDPKTKPAPDAKARPKAKANAKAKAKPAQGPAPAPTFLNSLKLLKGFAVEPVHVVDRANEGSWVSMTLDPKGRLIASDQYGKLYRITPSKPGGPPSDTRVEPIDVPLGEAQGLLWAFDRLYVVVNRGEKYPSGLYSVSDTDGDDKLDKVETLRLLNGGGEHGPHAVVLAPDGKSLYVVAGNATQLPEIAGSQVPRHWGEDYLLPRMVDGNGFMKTEIAPGGYVCRVTPDGKSWTLVSMGYRNAYDLAFNKEGDAFTFDSDMEWDINTPWYRPTRVCNAVSGCGFWLSERGGQVADLLPTIACLPWSTSAQARPTGVTFGYGARFPGQVSRRLLHLGLELRQALRGPPQGQGSSAYSGEIRGVHHRLPPAPDRPRGQPVGRGSIYFAIGGRRKRPRDSTGSSTYAASGVDCPLDRQGIAKGRRRTGPASRPSKPSTVKVDPKALAIAAWPALSRPGSSDPLSPPGSRSSSRSSETWKDKALAETATRRRP